MKRFGLLLISVFLFFASNAQYPQGSSCSDPIVISVLPYSAQDHDTQVMQNIYSATSCASDQAYMSGKDLIYTYTPDRDIYVNINVSSLQMAVGLFIFNNCPDQSNSCYASNASFYGIPSFSNLFLQQGITYYIVVSTNFSDWSVGRVIYDIEITEAVHDISTTQIVSPQTGCNLGNSESVVVKIKNTGQYPVSPVSMFYQLDGGTPVSATYSTQINVNGVVTYTFPATADFSQAGSHVLKVYAHVTADNIATNDTLVAIINNTIGIGTFPFIDDLENTSSGYWVPGGINSSWVLGNPDKQYITAPYSDDNCWVTGLTANCAAGEESWVESPCFDLSQLTNPILKLMVFYMNSDGWVNIQYSIDNGTTWTILPDNSTTINWYGVDGHWTGLANKWLQVQRQIPEFLNVSNVRFRIVLSSGSGNCEGMAFDDFIIEDCILPEFDFAFTVDGADVTFNNNSVNSNTVAWYFGDVTGYSYVSNPVYTYAATGTYQVQLVTYNSCGNDTAYQNVVITTTGVQNLSNNKYEIKIVDNNLILQNVKEKIYLSLINYEGREMINFVTDKNITVPFNNLSPGIYLCKIIAGSKVNVHKVFVK